MLNIDQYRAAPSSDYPNDAIARHARHLLGALWTVENMIDTADHTLLHHIWRHILTDIDRLPTNETR